MEPITILDTREKNLKTVLYSRFLADILQQENSAILFHSTIKRTYTMKDEVCKSKAKSKGLMIMETIPLNRN